MVVALALALTEAVNDPVIVIVTPADVAGLPEIQEITPPEVVIVTLTLSLLLGGYVNGLLVETGELLTNHWYNGVVPPLVGVAVKLTDVPLHTELADAAIFTEATDDGDMVTVTVVEL